MASLVAASPTPRDEELELLQSMYYGDELQISPSDPHSATIHLSLEPPPPSPPNPITISVSLSLPPAFPSVPPSISLQSPSMLKSSLQLLTSKTLTHLSEELSDGNENLALAAVSFVRDELESSSSSSYLSAAPTPPPAASVDTAKKERAKKNQQQFMREWCSFVSLYKESYASGPNRYEVLLDLANGRGLKITGMAIAGKPGGLVVEGGEGDVLEFMHLIRTDFFETLNPRGRKVTTRWQERLPDDRLEDERECALAMRRLEAHRADGGEAALGESKKAQREREMREESARKDGEFVDGYAKKYGGVLAEAHTEAALASSGFQGELSAVDIDGLRAFPDFSIFAKTDYESNTQEAAKLFKSKGLMDGFDAMFAYRYS